MTYDLYYDELNFSHKVDGDPSFSEVFEKHFHLLYEINFLIAGEVDLLLENKLYHPSSGDMIFIKPGEHHCVTPNKNKKYERYVLKFPESLIPSTLLDELKNKPSITTIKRSVLPEIFTRFDWHYKNYAGNDMKSIMINVLNEVLAYFCALDKETEKKEIKYLNNNMEDIVKYINEHIEEDIKIKDICDKFHYSRSYICKEFMLCMQVPIKQYIRTKKIFYAHSLIQAGKKPTEVYNICGYNEYSTFYRNYVSIIGKAPGL